MIQNELPRKSPVIMGLFLFGMEDSELNHIIKKEEVAMYIQNVEFMDRECGTRDEFIIEIIEDMNKKYSGKYLFESRIVDALNGTKVNAVVALDAEKNAIFQLPIDAAYECSVLMGKEEVIERMCHNIELFEAFYVREERVDAEKQIIQPWVINKDLNQDLLHRCPYSEYGDYVIVYRECPSFNDYQLDYGLITWESAERLSLDLTQLHELAMRNVQNFSLYTIQTFNGYWFETIDNYSYHKGNEYEEYMVCGMEETCTTGSLFCKEIWRKMGQLVGENYYIIPSSVHEWIVMSGSMTLKEKLEETITSVNADLKPEYILGEQYYLYDVEKDEMTPMKRKASLKDE